MKVLLGLLFLISTAFAQEPVVMKNFDNKIYSLKTKGIKDFVVDIESSKLTKQMNDQQLFGKIDKVVFRTYWTANPERLAMEIIGLPEGFKEVKEELKTSMLAMMDDLIPQTTAQKFAGYKLAPGQGKEVLAQDTSGIAPVPSFTLKYDELDKLTEIVGNKPIGTMVVRPLYERPSFADGKWVLTKQQTTSSENGQTVVVEKKLEYGKSQGIGVLSAVEVTTVFTSANAKPATISERITFGNYKIDAGEALKYFLGETKAAPAPAAGQ